jgi:predicted acylesterase/phospholipase RssA
MSTLEHKKILEDLPKYNYDEIPINLVITGGGYRAYYLSLVQYYILNYTNLKVNKCSGASIGAICGATILCKIDYNIINEAYEECREKKINPYAKDFMYKFLNEGLPDNAHEICNNRLFIAVHEVTLRGLKKHIISEFTSKEDLIQCLLASSSIPYITIPTLYYTYRDMKCIDGFIPYCFDEPYIYVDLTKLPYSMKQTVYIGDLDVDKVMSDGITDFAQWYVHSKPSKVFRYVKPQALPGNKWFVKSWRYFKVLSVLYFIYRLIVFAKRLLHNK